MHGTEINVDSCQEFGQKLRLGHGPIHHSRRQRPNAGFTAKGTANSAHGLGSWPRLCQKNKDPDISTNHRMCRPESLSIPVGTPGTPTPCSTAILGLCRYPLLLLPLSIHLVIGALRIGQSALWTGLSQGSGLRFLENRLTGHISSPLSLRPPSNPSGCVSRKRGIVRLTGGPPISDALLICTSGGSDG